MLTSQMQRQFHRPGGAVRGDVSSNDRLVNILLTIYAQPTSADNRSRSKCFALCNRKRTKWGDDDARMSIRKRRKPLVTGMGRTLFAADSHRSRSRRLHT